MIGAHGPSRVGIVGLGLMGGSLALALARRGVAIVGADPDEAARAELGPRLAGGVLAPAPTDALGSCEVVVLAVPLGALAAAAEAVRPCLGPDAVVTDLTSLKAAPLALLAKCLPEARLVGSHPMAGRERGGTTNADPDMFAARPWAIVRGACADDEAVERVRALAHAVGAVCVDIGADAHDRTVAALSHLPYLLSGALARAASRLAEAGAVDGALAGPGLEGMLRLSAQPAWMDAVSAENAANVRGALDALEVELAAARAALEEAADGGGTALVALGEAGRLARARLLGRRSRDGA